MKIFKYIFVLILFVGFTACEEDDLGPDDPVVVPEFTPGSVDFSSFVALGASFTGGFTDNALFIAGQENSFPNIIAGLVETGMNQPLMNDNIGGLLIGGMPSAFFPPRLYFDGEGPAVLPGSPTTEATNILSGPFNNIGVPSAKSFHALAPGYGNPAGLATLQANPYFVRMASNPNTSMLQDAVAQNPTFFTLIDMGGNDILFYAARGASGVDQTGNPNPQEYGLADLTDPQVFAASYSAIINALSAGGSKGVVSNIPNITDFAFFNTVPYNPLDPTNPDFGPQIPTLNAAYAQLNAAFAFLEAQGIVPNATERQVVFNEDAASAVVIHDESLDNIAAQLAGVLQAGGLDPLTAGLLANQYGQSRQANENDLLTLTSSAVIATLNEDYFNTLIGLGVDPATAGQLSINGLTYPMEDSAVLLPSELAGIMTATNAYNDAISAIVQSNDNVVLVDLKSVLEQASTTGIQFGDFIMNTDLVFGGMIGLDGFHLTSRGYALLANEILKVLDANFESNFIDSGNVPSAGDYPTNYPPTLQ